jgi:hypothetical protein
VTQLGAGDASISNLYLTTETLFTMTQVTVSFRLHLELTRPGRRSGNALMGPVVGFPDPG